MASTPTRDLPEEFLAATRKSQEAMIRAIKTWVETVRTVTPKLPSAYVPFADRLPKLPPVTVPFANQLPTPEEVVASGYDFAEHLLQMQRKFAEDLLEVTEPLIPGHGKRAWARATKAASDATKAVADTAKTVADTAKAAQQAVAPTAPNPPVPATPKPTVAAALDAAKAQAADSAPEAPAPKPAQTQAAKPAPAKSAPKPASANAAPKPAADKPKAAPRRAPRNTGAN